MAKPFILLALCFSSAAVLAAGGKPALSEFEGIDADRDGRVSAAEHAAAARKMFQVMDVDRDGDGILSAAEHAAASKSMFGKMDSDRDGYLSKDERAAGHAALMRRAAK